MSCNVCGGDVDVCENCLVELAVEFKCYEEAHFCGRECWVEWLVKEEESKLEDAENDEAT